MRTFLLTCTVKAHRRSGKGVARIGSRLCCCSMGDSSVSQSDPDQFAAEGASVLRSSGGPGDVQFVADDADVTPLRSPLPVGEQGDVYVMDRTRDAVDRP